MMEAGEMDDPLLQFTSWMEEGTRKHFTETVSLVPLFSCAAAAEEALDRTSNGQNLFSDYVGIARELEQVSLGTRWAPLVPHDALRTGIVLLRSEAKDSKWPRPEEVREGFQKCHVALTTYENGLIRLSAPPEGWQEENGELLRLALERTIACDKHNLVLTDSRTPGVSPCLSPTFLAA
jgi:hypothetical protein